MNQNLVNSENIVSMLSSRGQMAFSTKKLLLVRRAGVLLPVAVGAFGSMIATGAHAAGTAASNGIGQQFQNMAQEGSSTSGIVGSAAMYACSIVCFLGGAWAFWQSRQPQSRDGGMIAKGFAGLLLCGLFATGGTWIGKSAQTTGGTASTLTSDAGEVGFGG